MKIKAIIFDYDGVIVDSFPTIHKVYQIICKKLGKKCPEKFPEFKKFFGYNSRNFIKNLGLTEEETRKFDEFCSEEILNQEPKFFHKIDDVIKKLKEKYKLIIVSSNTQREVENKMKLLGVHSHFNIIMGGKVGPLKKSTAFKELIKDLNLSEDEILVVGDRVNDYFDAKEAGLNNIILVEYGWGYEKEKIPNHKQSIIVKKPLDLIKAVESFEK
jgi:HAD superfamily hydrolase (TIGR01549 family)